MTSSGRESLGLDQRIAEQVVREMRTGVVLQDATGQIKGFNPAALDALALSADQLLGKTSTDPDWHSVDVRMRPFPGERHPAMRCLRTGQPQLGVVMGIATPAQGLRWLRIDSRPTTWNDEPAVVTTFTDITAERNARYEVGTALQAMQNALLPPESPVVAGYDIATFYRAAGGTVLIGGDFYDVIDTGDDALAFFIGDVCGHDVEAMAVTALARFSLRAASRQGSGPEEALARLHRTLIADAGGVFCTALFGMIQRHQAGMTLTVSSGGHPPPIVVSADGSTRVVDVRGTLLGGPVAPSCPPVTIELAPGDQFFCYTDGLTDGVRPRLTEEDLRDALRRGDTADETLEATLEALPGQWEETADDMAVLVIGTA